jgi:GGDEF domain-containing protein
MNKAKRIGLMFIILGFFIPLVFYPFTELTEDAKKTQLLYVYRGENYSPRLSELKVDTWRYPSIIAIGLVSIFTGISIIVLAGRKKSKKAISTNTTAQPFNKSKEELSAKNVEKEIVEDKKTKKAELDASSSTDVVDEVTDKAEVDAFASEKVDDKIESDKSNSFQTFIVIMFAIDDIDELIKKIGADYEQELFRIIFGHTYKFFLSYGGFASRDTTNEILIIIQNCDLEKGENLCKRFKSFFIETIIPDLNANIKMKKSDEVLEVRILAGIALGKPMIEMESIKESARFNLTPIVRIRTPKS